MKKMTWRRHVHDGGGGPRVVSVLTEGASMTYAVPFSPREEWALTPSLDVVFGVSDPYRFEVRRAAGRPRDLPRRARRAIGAPLRPAALKNPALTPGDGRCIYITWFERNYISTRISMSICAISPGSRGEVCQSWSGRRCAGCTAVMTTAGAGRR